MDIGKKIYIGIMCERLFKIISKHGVKFQFGSTPGVGCQDGTFTKKTLLHLGNNYNLPKWVALADLFKSFNNSNHELLIGILGKYGAPPRLFSVIKRMYDKSKVNINIGNIETAIDFKVGSKQGDRMAPVLFMFLIMVFAETLEDKWTDQGLRKYQFSRKENSLRSTRQLVIHRPRTFTPGTLFDIFCMLYVDDGAFVF